MSVEDVDLMPLILPYENGNDGAYWSPDSTITYVQEHPDCINVIKADYFLLYLAASAERVDIIDVLISLKCNVNLSRNDGSTALMESCSKGDRKIVETLLAAGADPQMADDLGYTSLHLFCNPSIDFELVHIIYNYGGNPDALNNSNETPLLSLIKLKEFNVKLILTLVEITTNINQRNNFGETALLIACTSDYVEVALALLERGADPYICDNDGDDCFDAADTQCQELLNQYKKKF